MIPLYTWSLRHYQRPSPPAGQHIHFDTVSFKQFQRSLNTRWRLTTRRIINKLLNCAFPNFLTYFFTYLVWQWTGVCMDGHPGTSQITSSQPLMLLLAVVVYVLQTWTVSLYLAADLARTSAGLFIMLARQSGTRCQMNLEILTVTASIVLNGFWKQSFLAATSVTSALEVIFITRCAI